MMEAARTSETSEDIQLRTRQYIPEDSELHTRRRENLKSHKRIYCLEKVQINQLNVYLQFKLRYDVCYTYESRLCNFSIFKMN
jgi:hypothetical protein